MSCRSELFVQRDIELTERFATTILRVMPDSVSAILSATAEPVAIFTDFDGTLVEIAPSPDAVLVPGELPQKLEQLYLALDGALAVITGRTIADIDGFLPHQSFAISGSHGAERRHAGEVDEPDSDHVAGARQIAINLEHHLADEAGILIEPKPTGVAVHYRAAPEKRAEVERIVGSVVAEVSGFQVIEGKKVVEARPLGTDKGEAIRALMAIPPFLGRTPVFIGDDVSDEDGFIVANELGGFGIKVGSAETVARFSVAGVGEVYAYLDALIGRSRSQAAAAENASHESMTK